MFKFWISIKSIPTENIKLENKTIHRTDTRNNTTILEKKNLEQDEIWTDYQKKYC
jgi:hypothetical protein